MICLLKCPKQKLISLEVWVLVYKWYYFKPNFICAEISLIKSSNRTLQFRFRAGILWIQSQIKFFDVITGFGDRRK